MHYNKIQEIIINNKKIGQNYNTYFIAEAGLNHNGDIKIAKKMIESAYNCGADAIKFQTYITENFLTTNSEYFKFFKNVELSPEDFGELKDYSQSTGITFFSAPFDIVSADNLMKIGVPCFKIASSDLTNFPLIRHIAKFHIPMMISTGLATLDEVRDAIELCQKNGNNSLMILHCIANYPTLPQEANLNAIITLREKFSFPIGYSDNGDSTLVDLVAVSLGACLIEKHFTLDRKFPGPDHFFSIDPNQLKQLISEIRLIEQIKGNGIKSPQKSEVSNISTIRKSITARFDLHPNQILTENDLSIKRPALGIEPKYFSRIIGKKINKLIKKDTPITWEDLN